jgi:hypothetical protein
VFELRVVVFIPVDLRINKLVLKAVRFIQDIQQEGRCLLAEQLVQPGIILLLGEAQVSAYKKHQQQCRPFHAEKVRKGKLLKQFFFLQKAAMVSTGPAAGSSLTDDH